MDNQPFDHTFEFKDDPSVSEVYADRVCRVTADGSSTRVTLTISRPDLPSSGTASAAGHKVVAARLVLSPQATAELYNHLSKVVHLLEQKGVIKREGGTVTSTLQ